MRSLLLLILFFPLAYSGQILRLLTDPPLQFSKAYILDNKISCLSVSETRGHSKRKPYNSYNYELLFDSTGSLCKIISPDPTSVPVDPAVWLMDQVDTIWTNRPDTVLYTTSGQVCRTSHYNYKEYYAYDSKGRMAQQTSVTPSFYPTFWQTQFTYDQKDRLNSLAVKRGQVREKDTLFLYDAMYVYRYSGDTLTAVEHIIYKNHKEIYRETMQVDYDGRLLSKITITNRKRKDYLTVTFRVCRKK